jgi:hypothetical protein
VTSAREKSYDWSIFSSENMDFCQANLCNAMPHTMCFKVRINISYKPSFRIVFLCSGGQATPKLYRLFQNRAVF